MAEKTLQKKMNAECKNWQQPLAEMCDEIEAATRMAQAEKPYNVLFRQLYS